MPQLCSICRHPECEAINKALVNGEPHRNIAKHYGASASAVFRHRDHIPRVLTKIKETREAGHAEDLLGQIRDLQERAIAILEQAEASGDLRAAIGAIRETRGCLELLGKVTGELVERHAHIHGYAERVKELPPMDEDEKEIIQAVTRRLTGRLVGKPEEYLPPLGWRRLEPAEIVRPVPGPDLD